MNISIQYPYRDTLRRAQDIYLDVMCDFIYKCLNQYRVDGETAETIIKRHAEYNPDCNILDTIDFDFIPFLFRTYWDYSFKLHFDRIDSYYEARSAVQMIVEGRNRTSHPPWDIDPDYTRTHLSIIAEILGKVERKEKQDEVKVIRDELFYDDSKDRFEEAEKRIRELELENDEYNDKNKELSQKIIDNAIKIEDKSKQLRESLKENNENKKELEKRTEELNETQASIDDFKKQIETTNKELTDANSEMRTSKDNLSNVSSELTTLQNDKKKTEEHNTSIEKQLNAIKSEKVDLEKHLSTTLNLLNILSVDSQTLEHIYPHLDTDSKVRVLDRRNKGGRYRSSYLTNLLKLRQPTIIYVDSEEMIGYFFTHIAGEKGDLIGRHNDYSSDTDEKVLLDKLVNGDLIAVVSSATFTTISEKHEIEHFVFCHPILYLEEFSKQCQPAFMPTQNAYLHLLYDTKQDFDSYSQNLDEKYPERETLKELFKQLRDHVKANGNSVNLELLCQDLDMKITGVETGIAIFEELQFIERIDQKINLLESNKKQLEDSKIYSNGKKLKEKADRESYQLGMDSIENLWEKILDTLDIEKKHIINKQEENTGRTNNGSQHETTVDESDSVETEQVVTPKNSGAKVNAEQVRVIRERAADGETLSILSREYGMSSTGIWNIVNRNTWKDIE